jgi:hypothetical protein
MEKVEREWLLSSWEKYRSAFSPNARATDADPTVPIFRQIRR